MIRLLERAAFQLPPGPRAQSLWRLALRSGSPLHRVVHACVGPGQVVADVGANWGRFSGGLISIVGPTGKVYAFEPNLHHRATLDRIVTPPHVVRYAAVGDAAGTATLDVPEQDAQASLSSTGQGIEVPLTTLDAEIEGPVHFIKCDVEGHEMAVFRGAARLLEQRPIILVEMEERHGADLDAAFAFFAGLGYTGFSVGPGGLAPVDRFDVERDQRRWLQTSEAEMSEGYVNDFLFVTELPQPARALMS